MQRPVEWLNARIAALLGGGPTAELVANLALIALIVLLFIVAWWLVNHYLRNYLDSEFRLGVGIAYGPMVTGEIGFPGKRQFTAIGDTVNIAARLESETRRQDCDVLVSDTVLRNLPGDICRPARSFEFELKGKQRKVCAHELRF